MITNIEEPIEITEEEFVEGIQEIITKPEEIIETSQSCINYNEVVNKMKKDQIIADHKKINEEILANEPKSKTWYYKTKKEDIKKEINEFTKILPDKALEELITEPKIKDPIIKQTIKIKQNDELINKAANVLVNTERQIIALVEKLSIAGQHYTAGYTCEGVLKDYDRPDVKKMMLEDWKEIYRENYKAIDTCLSVGTIHLKNLGMIFGGSILSNGLKKKQAELNKS